MHTSLRAISGVAAMTNSSYEDISRIFTTVAGNGRLMGDQLLQLSSRGLNVAATLGETLHMTEADIRDLVSKGKISFEVFASAMDDAFGAHAKDANKTFEGALSNMKAALSRVGALFATPIIEKTNTFFIAVTGRINKVKEALSDVKDEDGKVVKKGFASYFAEAWEAAINFASKFVENIDLSWFENVADKMSAAAQFATSFFNLLSDKIDKTSDKVKEGADIISVAAEEVNAALKIFFGGKFGNGLKRIQGLTAAGLDAKKVQKFLNEYIKAGYDITKMQIKYDDITSEEIAKYIEVLQKNGYDFKKAGELTAKVEDTIKVNIGDASTEIDAMNTSMSDLVNASKAAGDSVEDFNKNLKLLDEDSQESVILLNIVAGLESLVSAFDNVLDTAKYVFGTVKNLIRDSFSITEGSSFFVSFADKLDNITGKISAFAQMLLLASNDVNPLYEGVAAMGDKIEYVGGKFKYIEWQERINAIYKAIKSTVDHIKVIFGNFFKTVLTIGGAIGRAFRKVFRPDDVANGIDSFGGSVEKLSEIILKAAELIAPTIELIFTAIFKVAKFLSGSNFLFKPIVNFLGELFGVKDAIEETDKAVEHAGETAEKTGGIVSKIGEFLRGAIEKLPGLLETIFDKISKIPEVLKKLRDELSQREGVKSLVENCKQLGSIINKNLDPALKTAKDGINNIGKGESGKDIFGAIVNAIDWLAGKLAWVVGILPVVGDAIRDFFVSIKDGASTAYDSVKAFFTGLFGSKEDPVEGTALDGEVIKDAVDPSKNQGVFASVKAFGENLFKSLKDGAGNISLSKIGGFLVLFGLARTFLSLGSLTSKIAAIPSTLSKVIKSSGTLLKSFGSSLKMFTIANMIESITKCFATILGLVLLLAKMPEEDIAKAVTVVSVLGVLFYALIKGLSALTGNKGLPALFNTGDRGKVIQKGTVNLSATIGNLWSVALLIFSIGSAIKNIATAVKTISEIKEFGWALLKFAVVFGIIVAGCIGIIAFAKTLVQGAELNDKMIGKTALVIAATAGLIFVLSISMAAIAIALRLLPATSGKGWAALGMMTIILAELFAFSYGMAALTKNASYKSITRVAILIAVVAGAMTLIIAEIVALAIAVKVFDIFTDDGSTNPLVTAIAAMGTILVAIGLFVMLATKHATAGNEKGIKAMTWLMVSVVAMVGVLGYVLYQLAKLEWTSLIAPAIAVLGGLAVMMTIIGLTIKKMSEGKITEKQLDSISGVLLTMAIAIAALGIVVGYLAKFDIGKVALTAAVIAGFFAAFVVLGIIVGKLNKGGAVTNAIESIASSMLVMGLAVTAVAAGVWILSEGLKNLAPFLPLILTGFEKFLDILSDHWGVVLMITIAIVALSYAFGELAGLLRPIASAIGEGLKTIISHVKELGETLLKAGGELLAKIGSKLSSWFSKLSTKSKGVVTGLILSICLSITDTGPTIIKTIGTLLSEAISSIIKSIPTIIDKLVIVLIKIIDGLADSIINHSSRIAAAFWGVVGALLGLVGSIIDQGLIMLLGPIGEGIVGWLHGNGINISEYYKQNVKRMRELAEMEDNFDIDQFEWDEQNRLTMSELRSQINKDLEKIGNEKYDESVTDAILAIESGKADNAIDVLRTANLTEQEYIDSLKKDKSIQDAANLQNKFITSTELLTRGFKWDKELNAWIDATGRITEVRKAYNTLTGEFDESTIVSRIKSVAGEAGIWVADLEAMGDTGQKVLTQLGRANDDISESIGEANTTAGNEAANKLYDSYEGTSETRANEAGDNAAEAGAEIGEKWGVAELEAYEGNIGDLWKKNNENEVKYLNNSLENLSEYQEKAKKIAEGDTDFNLIKPAEIGGYGLDDDLLRKYGIADSVQDYMEKNSKKTGESAGEEFSSSAVTTALNKAKEYLKKGFGEGGMEGLFNIFSEEGIDVGSAEGESIITGLLGSFVNSTDKVKLTTAATVKEGVTDPVSSQGTKKVVQESFETGVVNPAVNAIASSKTDMGEAMHHAFYGLEEAFHIRSRNFISMWNSFVSRLPECMRSQYEIKSPSRVFEQIGEYVIAGFTRGIDYNASEATDAMTGMSTSILDAFGNPLMKVAKIASGELQYDPSIRPVLDTSAIGYGAQNINSMFDNQNISLSGLSGQLATDVGEMQASNADIIAELQALREEMSILGDNMADMQVVMDSGALVGAITPGVDRALGMRNIYRGRGN